MKRLFKEPLFHFILIGAAFFLLYSWVGETDNGKSQIRIDESDLEEIVSKFEMQWKRMPNEEELISIVEKRIEQEVFYQEALKMNLDHNDEIIKRRLSQKMQFLSNDISGLVEPTDDQLQEYYRDHEDKYLSEAYYTLYQVYFSPDSRDNWRADAETAVQLMNRVSIEEALKMGDPISLPQTFNETSAFHISRQMGDAFLTEISQLETGKWIGPVNSGYGVHVVFISAKQNAEPAPFESVREKVSDDYSFEKQAEVKSAIFREFEKKYQIEFDIQSEQFPQAFVDRMESEILGE